MHGVEPLAPSAEHEAKIKCICTPKVIDLRERKGGFQLYFNIIFFTVVRPSGARRRSDFAPAAHRHAVDAKYGREEQLW